MDRQGKRRRRRWPAMVHTDPEDAQTSEEQIAGALANGQQLCVGGAAGDAGGCRAREGAERLKGIYFQKEFQRFYPDNESAAQVLGYVGTDDNGLGGLEQKFEPQLHGAPGHMYTAVDARRARAGLERERAGCRARTWC